MNPKNISRAEKISRQLSFSSGISVLVVNFPPNWETYINGEMSTGGMALITGATIAVAEGIQKFVENELARRREKTDE